MRDPQTQDTAKKSSIWEDIPSSSGAGSEPFLGPQPPGSPEGERGENNLTLRPQYHQGSSSSRQ